MLFTVGWVAITEITRFTQCYTFIFQPERIKLGLRFTTFESWWQFCCGTAANKARNKLWNKTTIGLMPLYLPATGLHLAAPSPSRSESDSRLTNRHERGKEERAKPSSGGGISQSGYNNLSRVTDWCFIWMQWKSIDVLPDKKIQLKVVWVFGIKGRSLFRRRQPK